MSKGTENSHAVAARVRDSKATDWWVYVKISVHFDTFLLLKLSLLPEGPFRQQLANARKDRMGLDINIRNGIFTSTEQGVLKGERNCSGGG